MLFLGGPLNGTWRAVEPAQRELRVIKPEPLSVFAVFDEFTSAMSFTTMLYRRGGLWSGTTRRTFASNNFEVWTVNGVTPPDHAVFDETWPDDIPPPLFPQLRARSTPSSLPISSDAHTVSFSTMTTEAETELAEWDRILHGR